MMGNSRKSAVLIQGRKLRGKSSSHNREELPAPDPREGHVPPQPSNSAWHVLNASTEHQRQQHMLGASKQSSAGGFIGSSEENSAYFGSPDTRSACAAGRLPYVISSKGWPAPPPQKGAEAVACQMDAVTAKKPPAATSSWASAAMRRNCQPMQGPDAMLLPQTTTRETVRTCASSKVKSI